MKNQDLITTSTTFLKEANAYMGDAVPDVSKLANDPSFRFTEEVANELVGIAESIARHAEIIIKQVESNK